MTRRGDEVILLDDRSLNGVFVNGEQIEWRALQSRDVIVIGRFTLAYVEVGLSEPFPAT